MTTTTARMTALERRIEGERRVLRRLLRHLLQDGCSVSLHDSEEWAVKRSRDLAELSEWLHATDLQTLRWRDAAGVVLGHFTIIYGNSAEEVIADYTANERCEAAYNAAHLRA